MTELSPIFILAGTPGAGKSSVAVALLRRSAHGLHIPVDDLREMVVAGIAHPVPEWTDETGRQFGLARRSAAAMARVYAAAGFAVVIDDVLGPADAEAFPLEAAEFSVRKVLLRPSLDVALQRSAARTVKSFDAELLVDVIRRLYETADPAAYAAHGWQIIDSSELSVEETVDAIRAAGPPMVPNVDRRGVLDDEVFAYRAGKDKVFISWRGKPVMTLKGRAAERFLARIDGLEGKAAQLVMAKVTGNFKHGNER